MNCEGSIEQGKGTYSLVTINAGATFNAAQKLTQTTGTYKLSSAAASTDIVDIYGALKVKGSTGNFRSFSCSGQRRRYWQSQC